MAKEPKAADCKPGEASQALQKPQFPEDQHCPNYDNDASGWVRGVPSGEAKPGFDKHKAGR